MDLEEVKSVSLDQARAAVPAAAQVFARFGTVTGVGIVRVGKGYGIKVNLEAKLPDATLPCDVDGVPVRAEVVGRIRKLDASRTHG